MKPSSPAPSSSRSLVDIARRLFGDPSEPTVLPTPHHRARPRAAESTRADSRDRRRLLAGLTVATVALASSCTISDGDDDRILEPRLYSDVAGAGPGDGVEWQIDAPWRMEPDPDGETTYEQLPLVVSFHDMSMAGDDALSYGRFCGLYVLHGVDVTYIPLSDFYEVEASLRWLPTGLLELAPGGENAPPSHQLRRLWDGDSPEDLANLGEWAEWHGTALFDYVPDGPGDLDLMVMARVSETKDCDPEDPALDVDNLLQLQMLGRVASFPIGESNVFTEFLSVHYAEEPLPRFDDGWVYGDLHYHSQGTDNEGESGINYRGVIQAMKSMGIDYVFATDHTSDSPQITGIRAIYVNDLPLIPSFLDFVEQWLIDQLEVHGIFLPVIDSRAARDLSPARFAHLHDWLNGPAGVNAEAAQSGGSGRRPKIFLGGEVDVIPEISANEALRGAFTYAHDLDYSWSTVCSELPSVFLDYTDFEEGSCDGKLLDPGSRSFGPSEMFPEGSTSFYVRDVQGPGELWYARQHLIHLASEDPGAFVSSDTATYAGASRDLKTVMEEIEDGAKGVTFLAHPAAAASGSSPGRLGPDLIPYADTQLEVAFESPAVLGLQLWNEDGRQHSDAPTGTERYFPFLAKQGYLEAEVPADPWGLPAGVTFDWRWDHNEEFHLIGGIAAGTRMWDQMLRWGITPARIDTVKLEPGELFRKVYMSGGSDAHGDLNYRREGRFLGYASANDTAIAKPRNLTYVGPDRQGPDDTLGQTQVLDALRAGRFSVTDGPALRIAIDVNGNDVIDDEDVPMGGDFSIEGESAPLLVEWKSTPEFGPVSEINVYVGAQAGDLEAVTYATASHGPAGGGPCVDLDAPLVDPTGEEVCIMGDGRLRDRAGYLTVSITEGSADEYGGIRRFDLVPTDFPVLDYECTTENESIWVDDHWEPISIEQCSVTQMQYPERMYTRAFVRTRGEGPYLNRFAFSNPVWMTAPVQPSPPVVTLERLSCEDDVATYEVTATPGPVAGTISVYYDDGDEQWTPVPALPPYFDAPAGATVRAKAQACVAGHCSEWSIDSALVASCPIPVPTPPDVFLEHTGCSAGINSFVTTVTPTDPSHTIAIDEQVKVGSGSWQSSAGFIDAGSEQTVHLRAKACNENGTCSLWSQTSMVGPTCTAGGGTSPQ